MTCFNGVRSWANDILIAAAQPFKIYRRWETTAADDDNDDDDKSRTTLRRMNREQ